MSNSKYNQILNKMNNINPSNNYIPVKNMGDFNYDTDCYYNQYTASPYVTQQRRILRNYYNNNLSVKKFNKNPFLNCNNKINFLYTFSENYMIIEKNNKFYIYLWMNNVWNFAGCANNCNVIKKFIS